MNLKILIGIIIDLKKGEIYSLQIPDDIVNEEFMLNVEEQIFKGGSQQNKTKK